MAIRFIIRIRRNVFIITMFIVFIFFFEFSFIIVCNDDFNFLKIDDVFVDLFIFFIIIIARIMYIIIGFRDLFIGSNILNILFVIY